MEAYHLLLLLGDPIERNDRWRWYYVIGYTCPGIAVGISSAVKYSKPGGKFRVSILFLYILSRRTNF